MNICNYETTRKEEKVINLLQSLGYTELEKPMPLITDEPKFPIYFCHAKGSEDPSFDVKAHGKGFDIREGSARIKSIAEVLERLCLLNPERSKFTEAKYEEGSEKFIDPGKFCCYSSEQLDREMFIQKARNSSHIWWRSTDIITREKIFLPGQLIFLSRDFDSEFELRKEQISTGAAFGIAQTRSKTIKRSFFEVIERDSDMFSYLSNKTLARIVNLPTEVELIKQYIERYNLEVHLFDTSTSLDIPSVICAIIDRTGIGDAVNLGSSAGERYKEIIIKSMLESIQCRRAGRVTDILDPSHKISINRKPEEITNVEDRYLYCKPIERIKDLKKWLTTELEVDYEELTKKEGTFNEFLERFRDKGISVYLADISLPKFKEAGFETLKIIIPELFPLYLAENAKALYSEYHGAMKLKSELNPHLFT